MVFDTFKTRILEKKLLFIEKRQEKLEKLAKARAKEQEIQAEIVRRIKRAKQLRLTPKEMKLLEERKRARQKKIDAFKREGKFIANELAKAAIIIKRSLQDDKRDNRLSKPKTKKKSKSKSKSPSKKIFDRPKPKKKSKK